MSDRGWMEPIVERVVGQVLDSHVSQLRAEIVCGVMEEIAAQPANVAPPVPSVADLARAVSEIQMGTSQKEILRALLNSSSRYAGRVALFVVKGSEASGWEARGFQSSDALKDFALDCKSAAVLRILADRTAASVAAADFDLRFLEAFGTPAGEAQLLPLIVKDKVAALVYADAGTDGTLLDTGSLEVLVLGASAWLEVNGLRKQVRKQPASAPSDQTGAPTAAASSAPAVLATAFSDPFAAHAPAYAMSAAAAADSQTTAGTVGSEFPVDSSYHKPGEGVVAEAQSTAAEVRSAAAAAPAAFGEPLPMGHVESDVAPDTSSPAPAISTEDQEVHRKAQRFARLLVDEIKLYNRAKVSEGRKNHDLYDRLKDAIDKSRATYQKRYGNTVAASGNYFEDEVKRSLAEDDLRVMGPNFRI